MHEPYINIYQTARESSGLTQERAAERIGLSVESIRMYESGRRIPPDDCVVRMIDVYDARYLAYQHIKENVKVSESFIPQNIEIRDLPSAILRLQKEVTDFLKCREEMIEITFDGKITEAERPRWGVIVKELDDVSAAIMCLKFAKETEN